MNIIKKKALVIAYNDLNKSGVPNVIYQTIKALSNAYDFDVVVFNDDDYYYKKLLEENIKNVNLIKFSENEPRNKIKHIFWNLFSRPSKHYLDTKHLLENKKYDVVHSFKEYDSWPFLKACKESKIKKRIIHSTIMHGEEKELSQRLFSIIRRTKTFKYSTQFVGVSDLCCKKAFPKKKYVVIYNSYDEKIFNNSVANTLRDDDIVLTQLATFNSNKNQLFSLAVFLELRNYFTTIRLKLIGRETEKGYLYKIKQFITENSLENVVEIIDGNSSLIDHFAATTYTLLPSKKEGAGITAIESQACGIKVFASSNVPIEMNAGGMIFIDLKKGPDYWAEIIKSDFHNNKNNRKEFNMNRFSYSTFCDSIRKIYDN